MKTKYPFDGEIRPIQAKKMPDLGPSGKPAGWFLEPTASPPAAPEHHAESAYSSAAPGVPGEAEIADQIDEYLPNFGGSLEAARRILSLIRPAFEAKDAEIDTYRTCADANESDRRGAEQEIARLEAKLAQAVEARQWLSEAVNSLGDPCDACDFGDDDAAALESTIGDALSHLEKAAALLALAEGGEG